MTTDWKTPVFVTDKRGTLIAVHNAEKALVFMANDWPSAPGYLFDLACKRCIANAKNPDLGRSAELAFRAAVTELGMFPPGRISANGTAGRAGRQAV